ncbi:MAG: ABC transporter permease [Candidatus Omnitrophota bacterium]
MEKLTLDYSVPQTLRLKLSGDWRISSVLPEPGKVTFQFTIRNDIRKLGIDVSGMTGWDSGLVSFLSEVFRECRRRKIEVVREGLPAGIEQLLALADKPDEKVKPPEVTREPFFSRVGEKAVRIGRSSRSLANFLGEIAYAFGRFSRGKAYFRWGDFIGILRKCGVDALGLVSLISVLVGVILAFVGAIQLELFGAQIFIADIVGIAMVRVMGAVMTGVLMSGRTGASFAAELGIMQTNEEIDAFRTLGVNPVEFLVMPRVLALVVMMPLLTLYADFMGILGGFVISTGVLGINPVEYINHTQNAVRLSNLWVGLVHSVVFGAIIAVAGCLRGIKCERSAAGVGEATTSAVVSAITSIVIATAIITFICQVIKV